LATLADVIAPTSRAPGWYLREIRTADASLARVTIERERHVRHTDRVLTFDGSPSLPLRQANCPATRSLPARPAPSAGRFN